MSALSFLSVRLKGHIKCLGDFFVGPCTFEHKLRKNSTRVDIPPKRSFFFSRLINDSDDANVLNSWANTESSIVSILLWKFPFGGLFNHAWVQMNAGEWDNISGSGLFIPKQQSCGKIVSYCGTRSPVITRVHRCSTPLIPNPRFYGILTLKMIRLPMKASIISFFYLNLNERF